MGAGWLSKPGFNYGIAHGLKEVSDMATPLYCYPPVPVMPVTPFSFSLLIDSPIRCNLPFSPVAATILPLARVKLPYAGLIVAGLDVLMTFLAKRSLIQLPSPNRIPPEMYPVTLTLAQLGDLIRNASNGQPINFPNGNPGGQGFGPVGGDEPLFPDNLSFSLIVGAPFGSFDGSPDTSFNVPLFEIPGVPGNLIIALSLLVAQFLIERSGVGTPGCQPTPKEGGGA